jgi:hypothetical protein
MKLLSKNSRINKSLLRASVIALSVALAGNAFAANSHVATTAKTAHVTHSRVAAHSGRQPARTFDIGQLIGSLFGIPVQVTSRVTGQGAMDQGGYDPTFDSPTPAVDVDNSQSQAAIDASDQAMQQEDQSLQDLDASIAAAEQQNDAANAAAVQTDINAGM